MENSDIEWQQVWAWDSWLASQRHETEHLRPLPATLGPDGLAGLVRLELRIAA